MPRLNLDLTAITDARVEAAELRRTVQTSARQIADLKEQIARARRDNDANTAVQLADQLARLEPQHRAISDQHSELLDAIRRQSAALLGGRDPAQMVDTFDGSVPVALLPVRLETRYIGNPVQLAIRVYPDTLHVVRHGGGLTGPERQRGEDYWTARFAVHPADGPEESANAEAFAASLWRQMVAIYRAPRASWIVRILTPTNLADAGTPDVAPSFPDDIDDITSIARQPFATDLPDRWCAIGSRQGKEVFRVWGAGIPDILPMGPSLDPTVAPPAGAEKGIYSGDRKWLVDFKSAVTTGMGLIVGQQDLAPEFQFNLGLDRLVVLGVDWTLDPKDSANAVSALLQAHQAASEFSFVPLGTPTNNTGQDVSGFSSAREDKPAPVIQPDPGPGEFPAVELLRHALGLEADAFDSPNIPNATLVEPITAMHMINALWRATFGRYLLLMWNPWYPAADPDAAKSATDAYVPRQVINQLREFAVRYLRPGGSLPAFRIEKQPYGILPIVSSNYLPESAGGVESGVYKVLRALRSRWVLSSQKVPHLVDGDLQKATDLLQTGPWSQVFRYLGVDDPMASYYAPIFPGTDQDLSIGNQQTIKAELTAEFLGLFGIKKESPRDCMIDNLVVATDPQRVIGVPWVEADAKDPKRERDYAETLTVNAQGKNYIHAVRDALELPQQQAKSALNALQTGVSLLEALLAFSSEEEFDQGGVSIIDTIDFPDATRPFGKAIVSHATPQLVNIEAPAETESWVEIRTTRELANLRVPSVTGGHTIEDHLALGVRALPASDGATVASDVANLLFVGKALVPSYLQDLSTLKKSLSFLAERTVGELNIAFRTTLDAFGYRLDAWYTALATRRLEAARAVQPEGLYIGAYGWVENLPGPSRQPDSLGYVHAPSLAQAVTAAILRSGHLANHESAKGTFNIDLSSARVHRALTILEGVGRGQSLAGLLGYRFERSLRDNLLGQYTLPFRRAFPLRPAEDNSADGPKEEISVRDVVDGIKLLESRDASLNGLFAAVIAANPADQPPLVIPAPDRTAIATYLADLAETWDAVSDVLVAEGVYQVAQGNLERAGAALAVLDKQSRPIQPQVSQTPRKGVAYAQRVLVVCESDQLDPRWRDAGENDVRMIVEPRLNAWVAGMLGDPERFVFEAQVLQGDAVVGALLTVSPHQLGWSPLTLVLASRSVSGTGQAQHSALRASIAQALAAQVPNPDADTTISILSSASQPGMLGLDAFEALASTLGRLIESSRPLTRKEMVVPRDEIEASTPDEGEYPGADLDDIEMRATLAVSALEDHIAALQNAPDAAAILRLLTLGWVFGIAEPIPGTAPGLASETISADESGDQVESRRQRALAQAQSQLDEAKALAPDAPDQAGAGHGARVQNGIDRIKRVFGKSFPVLPVFTLGSYANEVHASLAQQDSLTASDEFAVCGWLPKLARVRESTDLLNCALTIHDTLLDPTSPSDFKVAQLPFRENDCWAALPQAWKNPADDPAAARNLVPQLAWIAHAPAGLNGIAQDGRLAGLAVDEWQEFVPSAWQTTAVSFHYDAPGSRPPQTMLLAVPPRVNMENWTFNELLATVNEAFDLAKLRTVRPQDMVDGLGLLLPANYLPENPTADVPSVRLSAMTKAGALIYTGKVALGKA